MERQYISMNSNLYQTITDQIRVSLPNSCILFIEQINNQMLEESYKNRKENIQNERGSVGEQQLMVPMLQQLNQFVPLVLTQQKILHLHTEEVVICYECEIQFQLYEKS